MDMNELYMMHRKRIINEEINRMRMRILSFMEQNDLSARQASIIFDYYIMILYHQRVITLRTAILLAREVQHIFGFYDSPIGKEGII